MITIVTDKVLLFQLVNYKKYKHLQIVYKMLFQIIKYKSFSLLFCFVNKIVYEWITDHIQSVTGLQIYTYTLFVPGTVSLEFKYVLCLSFYLIIFVILLTMLATQVICDLSFVSRHVYISSHLSGLFSVFHPLDIWQKKI